ncbi:MAG: helix-turn-helix transcriptional regulator [Planctomycetes bacterium]|nr:helix-turn-helix transcriptional regulator [Planctomycetota bacterium]
MTYFDLSSLDRRLYEAIHGGPHPAPRVLARMLRAAGVGFPCQVLAIDLDGRNWAGWGGGRAPVAHVTAVHPGMAYVSFQGSSAALERRLRGRGAAVGPPQPSSGAAHWIPAIQFAITALRARQFAALARSLPDASLEAERKAAQEALRAYRDPRAEYRAAVRHWLRLTLLRHQRQLHTVRRKLLEFLFRASAERDQDLGLGFPLHRAVSRLRETFSLPAYEDLFVATLDELAPWLRERRGELLAPPPASAARCAPVREALAFVLARHPEGVGLAEVSAAVHVSSAHLSRIFRRETGRTLTEHLQRLRVQTACRLLAESDAGLLEVARGSGFQTPEHFHRTFKRLMRQTPRHYRLARQA